MNVEIILAGAENRLDAVLDLISEKMFAGNGIEAEVLCGIHVILEDVKREIRAAQDNLVVSAESEIEQRRVSILKRFAVEQIMQDGNEQSQIEKALSRLYEEIEPNSEGEKIWEGSHAELLKALNQRVCKYTRSMDWPKSPAALSRRISNIERNLKKNGINIWRTRSNKGRFIRLSSE